MANDANALRMPLVGVGASAGGLEALTAFVGALPRDSGMAFFIIQHLDPARPSALVEILARVSPLEVVAATDGAPIHADVIYIAKPGSQLTIEEGALRLHSNGRTFDRPIDRFLASLAASAGTQSIGVLLSGSGTDGRLGLTAVREAGGFTLVQDDSAQFDGMPRAAIDAGVVDLVLPPAEIAAELATLVHHPYLRGESPARDARLDETADREAIATILRTLFRRRGVRFADYKRPTIRRRIARRMVVTKIESLPEYARFVSSDPAEVDTLFEEILIHVTEFFRDPQAFERLGTLLDRRLEAHPDESRPLRIWSVGCSSGEEAYSLAMLALEANRGRTSPTQIKVFATDVSELALATARAGIYAPEQCTAVDEARRERFFVPAGRDLQVRKELRELCVFARHDVTRDPPFSRMDIVACRNLLIYFGADLQNRILPTLHYALRPGGLLFLGRAESVGRNGDLFEVLDRDCAIYRARAGVPVRLPDRPRFAMPGAESPPENQTPILHSQRLERQAERMILARHGPPGVIVDDRSRVLRFCGDTSPFLRNASGRASHELLDLSHPDLRMPLSEALTAARSGKVDVVREAIPVHDADSDLTVTIRVVPLEHEGTTAQLVLFETPATVPSRRSRFPAALRDAGWRLFDRFSDGSSRAVRGRGDETQLLATRAELHRVVEEHEAKTEELNAANEQVLSSNEELQSTNEELQTAKEEVLASNEELTTVNEELADRNRMLSRANADLANLISSTNLPIVMIGHDRRIRWFSPAAGPMLNLMSSDIGRPVQHIKPGLNLPDLGPLVDPVLEDLCPREQLVQNSAGRWFRIGVTPYRTLEEEVDGAVIIAVDVDELKRTQADLIEQRTHAEWIVETVREPLVVVDDTLRVVSANPAYYRVFDAAPGTLLGRPLYEADARWNQDEMREWLIASLASPLGSETEVAELAAPEDGGQPRRLRLEAHAIVRADAPTLLLVAIQDVTATREKERLEAELVASVVQAQAEERESLARELHDETGQALSALLVGLRAVSDFIEDASGRALVDELRERARELLDAVGRLARGLHPTAVEELGLAQAVRELAEGFGRMHAIDMHLHMDSEPRIDALSPALRLAVYRVIQEALTNVARHARAGEVTVTLGHDAENLHITVSDDGLGLSDDAESGNGLGLRLMKRRVAQLGGRFSLRARGGGGTVLEVEVPMLEEGSNA